MSYFYNKKFSACKKLISSNIKNLKSDTDFLKQFLFICELELGNIKVSRQIFSDLMKNKPDLVSSRSILGSYVNNKHVSDLFNKFYSELEIEKMNQTITKEANAVNNFLQTAEQLEDYYKRKEANQVSG